GRRIILVGDHRQLPHLIDEEVVRALEGSDTGQGETGARSEDDLIKQSMFEYLKKRLGTLELQDKIPRRVTLDQQFRMHPVLGKYVSRAFYERYGEGFDSPLPADLFAHALPSVGEVPAVWLDVPASLGQAKGGGSKSRWRVAEADRIAEQLHRWLDAP